MKAEVPSGHLTRRGTHQGSALGCVAPIYESRPADDLVFASSMGDSR